MEFVFEFNFYFLYQRGRFTPDVLLVIIVDKIVGYGTLKEGNYIDLFYTPKDFQRQSIATQILSKLESKAKKNTTN